MNYIRPVVINAFKEEGEQYASAMNAVVDDVSKALQDSLSINGNFIDDIIENMREDIVGGIQIAAEFLKKGNVWGQILGWVLTFFGEKIPDLIRWFFGKSKETIIAEATEKIRSSIIEKITEQLHPIIFEQVKTQQLRIRNNIKQKIENSINCLEDSIIATSENGSKEDLSTKIAAMDVAITELNLLKQVL